MAVLAAPKLTVQHRLAFTCVSPPASTSVVLELQIGGTIPSSKELSIVSSSSVLFTSMSSSQFNYVLSFVSYHPWSVRHSVSVSVLITRTRDNFAQFPIGHIWKNGSTPLQSFSQRAESRYESQPSLCPFHAFCLHSSLSCHPYSTHGTHHTYPHRV